MDARQRIAVGAMSLGYLVVRHIGQSSTRLHERVASDAELMSWDRSLATSISELCASPHGIEELMKLVHEFRQHDQKHMRTSSFHMNRIAKQISQELHRISRRDATSLTASDLKTAMYVEQDVVPVIQTQIDGILHNHMLRGLL